MERKTRLELATPTLARWCSTTELLPHVSCSVSEHLNIIPNKATPVKHFSVPDSVKKLWAFFEEVP